MRRRNTSSMRVRIVRAATDSKGRGNLEGSPIAILGPSTTNSHLLESDFVETTGDGKMSEKRYQVFISSTYDDLKEERKAVQEAIITGGDFPIGMELFPAADEEQFEFIKRIIDESDYYVLILAGRYGSVPKGKNLSFTEQEYNYAISKGVPILRLLHKDINDITGSKLEKTDQGKKRLELFRKKVESKRLVTFWNSVANLQYHVKNALDVAKKTTPRTGWLRGDLVAANDILQKLVTIQHDNAQLTKEVTRLQNDLNEVKGQLTMPDNLAGLDHAITVIVKSHKKPIANTLMPTIDTAGSVKFTQRISARFDTIFHAICPQLDIQQTESTVSELIASVLKSNFDKNSGSRRHFKYWIARESMDTIRNQLTALGLIETHRGLNDQREWKLTSLGTKTFLKKVVILTN
jgi:Domain of unknown function (DUF4062)